jgi:hypothetical protein
MKVTVAFEGIHQHRKKRFEPLPAHPIRCLPKDDQSLLDPFVVYAGLPRATNSRGGGWTIEDPNRVLGVVPGQRHELAENPGLVPLLSHPIAITDSHE